MKKISATKKAPGLIARAVAMLLALPLIAYAGPTPEQKCEGRKNQSAGKYAACIAKAEKGFVTKGDATKYGEALVKCEDKLSKSWDPLGTLCPGDQTPIEDFLDACGQSVAAVLAGGSLGLDPVTCAADLATCDGNLTACGGDLSSTNADLGICDGNLTTCGSDLSSTNADLGGCNGNLATCAGDLSTTNADLGTCSGDLSTCGGDLSSTNADLGVCNGDLTTCNGELSSTNADLGTCNTDLSTCGGDLSSTNADLGDCQTDLAACEALVGGPPKTGQTACYDASGGSIICTGTGQDGDLQNGKAQDFSDNGDGTITDNLTGLMWEKLSDDDTIHDKDTPYTWTNAFSAKVATLNSGSFAGYNDWRLPNLNELETLRNLGSASPATFPVFSTGCLSTCTVLTCSCTQLSYYWSSSTYLTDPTNALVVNLNFGYTVPNAKAGNGYVRAVRAGS